MTTRGSMLVVSLTCCLLVESLWAGNDGVIWRPSRHIDDEIVAELLAKRDALGNQEFVNRVVRALETVLKVKTVEDAHATAKEWRGTWPVKVREAHRSYFLSAWDTNLGQLANAMIVALAVAGDPSALPLLEEIQKADDSLKVSSALRGSGFLPGYAPWAYLEIVVRGLPPHEKVVQSFDLVAKRDWWLPIDRGYFSRLYQQDKDGVLSAIGRLEGYSPLAVGCIRNSLLGDAAGGAPPEDALWLLANGGTVARAVGASLLSSHRDPRCFAAMRALVAEADPDTASEIRFSLLHPLGRWWKGDQQAIDLVLEWYKTDTGTKRSESNRTLYRIYLEQRGVRFTEQGEPILDKKVEP